MTGRQLRAALDRLSDDELDLPVLCVTVNSFSGEGVDVSQAPGPHPHIPDPVLLVKSIDAEMAHLWRASGRQGNVSP